MYATVLPVIAINPNHCVPDRQLLIKVKQNFCYCSVSWKATIVNSEFDALFDDVVCLTVIVLAKVTPLAVRQLILWQ